MTVPLPIDSVLDEVVLAAQTHMRLVVEAPPGAGKTTRVPGRLWKAGLFKGEIWVAEPRRLAARLMAHRVANEMGCRLGDLVGYSVRFDDRSSPNTRIRYVTSGILLRRLLVDPELSGIDCVVLDEFHERHLDTDLTLALTARAQLRRGDLRLVVMSATLDGARLAKVLGDCPRVRSEGRLYPLQVEFQPSADERPLDKCVSSALRQLLIDNPQTSTLVFLPGAAEIRRVQETIASLCAQASIDITILHGDMSLDAQAKAVVPGARPRVVLTTNIAESSITVDGVTAVIDSGLARQKSYSAFTGLSRLAVQKISRASAIQRAGRAGRTAPGRVIRLYTRGDFEARPEFEPPEILRADFSESLLLLHGAALARPSTSPREKLAPSRNAPTALAHAPHQVCPNPLDDLLLVDRPNAMAVEAAESLLIQLGALDSDRQLTSVGRKMLRLPLHPRLSRMLIACEDRRIVDLGALGAALLSERDLRAVQRSFAAQNESRRMLVSGDSDLIALVDLYLQAQRTQSTPMDLRALGIDPAAYRSVRQVHQHLRQVMRCSNADLEVDEFTELALAQTILLAFPDRVAKRRSPSSSEFVLRSGATTRLSDSSVVSASQWLVALDVEERVESTRGPASTVRLASAIHSDWLMDVLSDHLTNEDELCWTSPPGRVELRSRLRLGSLTVEESRRPAPPSPAVAALLADVVAQTGLLQGDEVTHLTTRLALASTLGGNPEAPSTDDLMQGLLRNLLLARNDLEGIHGGSLAQLLLQNLPHGLVDTLRTEVPESITLPKGRRCTIHYEAGRPPWIASRLQDFFGIRQTPMILSGRQKLVVHLLAPNQRAVQITDDLEGFWVRHYPVIRRELMRRYPRHPWPEDGLTASPPDPRPGRRNP